MNCETSIIKNSSFILENILKSPDTRGHISIDMLSITLPVPKEQANQLLTLLSRNNADFLIRLTDLTGKDAGSQKYKRRLDVRFANDSTLSIFLHGLNSRQNRVKISFNPNTVGHDRVAAILCRIRELWGESSYRLWMLRANVTRVDYVLDLPNIPLHHLITDYSYRSPYEAFFQDNMLSGFRYGDKLGCPIIFYDKVLEQGSDYRSYRKYTRIEKQHKPRARGAKSMFTVSELDKQKYSFQGLSFYDPKILIGMPERVYDLIVKYGLGKALSLMKRSDQRELFKRMSKYKIEKGSEFKPSLEQAFQSQLSDLKDLLVNPVL